MAEEDKRNETDYSSYLFIDDLLCLQRPLTEGADDELLFIVVHQVYELWFKLVLHELTAARDSLLRSEPQLATRRLRRAVAVEELLVAQLRVLETMSPEQFFEFRDPLAPASGFQSVQFREIEALSGGLTASPGAVDVHTPEQRERIARRVAEPNLWDATIRALEMAEFLGANEEGSTDGRSQRELAALDAIVSIYRAHGDPVRAWYHELFECLLDHDEVMARWRYHHLLMVAREIGRRQGTGGSLGVEYLARTLDKRFFPLLWEVRSQL